MVFGGGVVGCGGNVHIYTYPLSLPCVFVYRCVCGGGGGSKWACPSLFRVDLQWYLPLSLTVLVMSGLSPPAESTDDERIVKWHWEEVKGPLREEKVSADTDILTLTNLVPGNYTFRSIS